MSEIINQTTEEKLFLAAEIVKEKGRWELMDVSSSTNPRWFPGNGVISQLLQGVTNKNYRIRRFQGEFPTLPLGHEWHNPYYITPVELPEKYRLLTKDEARNFNNNISESVMITITIKEIPVTFPVMPRNTPITHCSPIYPYKPTV